MSPGFLAVTFWTLPTPEAQEHSKPPMFDRKLFTFVFLRGTWANTVLGCIYIYMGKWRMKETIATLLRANIQYSWGGYY